MMKRITLAGLLMAVAAAFALPLPASASNHTGTTTVDVVVAAGALTLSAHPSAATLAGAQFNATLPSQATGAFGTIEVTDGRGLVVPWTLTAASTNFTGVANGTDSIALSAGSPLQFAASTVTVAPNGGGVGTAAGGSLVAANTGVAIATGTNASILGDVVYSWNPDATITVPANTPAQTYRGTVTLTVA